MNEQEATIEFLLLKIQDFDEQLELIGKLNQDKLVARDIKALTEDVVSTLAAVGKQKGESE